MKEVFVGIQFDEPKMRDERGNSVTELSFHAIKVQRNSDYVDHCTQLMAEYTKLKSADINEWGYMRSLIYQRSCIAMNTLRSLCTLSPQPQTLI